MKRLELSESARADLASIRRYSVRTWGRERTERYMETLRNTMKGLLASTVVSRERDDLRQGLRMATSGRHRVFFETDDSRSLLFGCCTIRWTIDVILNLKQGTHRRTGEPTAEGRLLIGPSWRA